MKKNESFGEVVVGLFVAGVFVLLAFFTIVISGVDLFGGRKQPLDVYFSSVGNLRPHDSVIVRGVPVGQVKKMSLADSGVCVQLALTQRVRMRSSYHITVVSSSLLGGNYLSIDEGDGAELPSGARLEGEPPHDVMRDVSDVVAALKRTLSEEGTLGNIRTASESLTNILGRVEHGQGTFGKLLSNDDSIYTNLAGAVANLKTLTDRLEHGQSTIGKLLSDDGHVYNDLHDTIANMKTISDRAERGEGTLGKLLSKDDSVYTNLAATVANLHEITDRLDRGQGTLGKLLSEDDSVYTNLAATVAGLRTVMDRMDKGEGSLGKLSKDDALYNDVKGLVNDARQTLDGIRESTPLTTFSSIALGAL